MIDSVAMTVNVTNEGAAGEIYEIYAANRSWDEDQATWTFAAAGMPWQALGARGEFDRGSVVVGSVQASTTGLFAYTLNVAGVAIVQSWIDNPSTNFGFIISDVSNSNGIEFDSSESDTASNRPRLTISYTMVDATAPTTPESLAATPRSQSTIDLSWDQASDPESGVTQYNVYRNGVLIGSSNTTSLVDSGLQLNTPYSYQVSAVNSQGLESDLSSPAVEVTIEVVEQIFLRGTTWSQDFLGQLNSDGLGDGGILLADGPAPDVMPWTNIDQVSINFSVDVEIVQADLSLRGVNVANYAISNFSYDAISYIATWTLADPIGADKILVDLTGTVSAQRRFDVLPADVTQDAQTNRADIVGFLSAFGRTTSDAAFDIHSDINGTGTIGLLDLAGLGASFGGVLPAGVPASAPAALAVTAAETAADPAPAVDQPTIRRGVSLRYGMRASRVARPLADRVVDAVFAEANQHASSSRQTSILRSRRSHRPSASSLSAEIVDDLFR